MFVEANNDDCQCKQIDEHLKKATSLYWRNYALEFAVKTCDNKVLQQRNSHNKIFSCSWQTPIGFNALRISRQRNVTEPQSCINEICRNIASHITYTCTLKRFFLLSNILSPHLYCVKCRHSVLEKLPPFFFAKTTKCQKQLCEEGTCHGCHLVDRPFRMAWPHVSTDMSQWLLCT